MSGISTPPGPPALARTGRELRYVFKNNGLNNLAWALLLSGQNRNPEPSGEET
jgi:hypothetical protein